jgi:hypothetical protein
MYGVLAFQQWSVGGWSHKRVNFTYIQPMLMYRLPDGWYLAALPTTYGDWTAAASDRWTVPVGGGARNVFKLGRQPINAQLSAYNVVKPGEGPNRQLRFQFQFLFPKAK